MKTLAASLLMFLSTCPAAFAGGFLFVTFNGESSPMTEQIYFGLSRDGRQWDALNGAQPVLVSALGEKGVRDPYILRSHAGKKPTSWRRTSPSTATATGTAPLTRAASPS